MGAPASALYSLPDTSGVLAASRAGTGDLYAEVVAVIGIGRGGIGGIGIPSILFMPRARLI